MLSLEQKMYKKVLVGLNFSASGSRYKQKVNKISFIQSCFYSIGVEPKQEGESCGWALFEGDCGNCAEGLECAPDAGALPSCTICEKIRGNINIIKY